MHFEESCRAENCGTVVVGDGDNRVTLNGGRVVNKNTDLNIALKSVEKAEHSRVTALIFAIKTQTASK